MKSTKTLSYLSIPVMALTLSACGGDNSDSNDTDAPARLSVGVTDAPVDDASNVYVEFSGVTLIRAGRDGDQENDDDVVIRFTENHRIDLLAYQQGESYDLIDDEEIPAGEYAQMRLMVETDKLNDTVIIFNDGSSHELSVPSGDQTGLKLVSGFTATAGGELSLMLDFDLRKGIVETGNGDYKLKPTIRVIDTAEYGEIEGTVAQGLCAADDSMAIYVYQGEVSELLNKRSDEELNTLMNNLGGQCLQTLTDAFDAIQDDKPTVFLAYTIKGWQTPLAGHKDNHGGFMNNPQFADFQKRMGVQEGEEWDKFATVEDPEALQSFLDSVPFFSKGTRRYTAPTIKSPGPVWLDDRELATQAGFGKILDALARGDSDLADHIVTMSPDVTSSTNLTGWVNRRSLFARREVSDTFKEQSIPSAQKWEFSPEGQHFELGIAEMNLFLLLGQAGLAHSHFGERLIPIGTLYDPFVARGLDVAGTGAAPITSWPTGTPVGMTSSALRWTSFQKANNAAKPSSTSMRVA